MISAQHVLIKWQDTADCEVVNSVVLTQAYMEVRKKMWSMLTDRIGFKGEWRLVEQKVYLIHLAP